MEAPHKFYFPNCFKGKKKKTWIKHAGEGEPLRDLETSAVILGRELDSRLLQEKGPLNTWDEAPSPQCRYSVLSWQHQGHLNSTALLALASHKLVLTEKPCGRVVSATLWSFSMTSCGSLTLLLPDCLSHITYLSEPQVPHLQGKASNPILSQGGCEHDMRNHLQAGVGAGLNLEDDRGQSG